MKSRINTIVACASLVCLGCDAAMEDQFLLRAQELEALSPAGDMSPLDQDIEVADLVGVPVNTPVIQDCNDEPALVLGVSAKVVGVEGTDVAPEDPDDGVSSGSDPSGIDPAFVDPNGGHAEMLLTANITLEKTVFSAVLGDGNVISGTDFEGKKFIARLSTGQPMVLRIDDIEVGIESNPDILTYAVSYLTPKGKFPLCGMDVNNVPVRAIPINGRWDYRQGAPGAGGRIDDAGSFTFACQGHALAQCIELGYKPWGQVEGRLGADYHQACVRAIRGDFCGDGTPYTEDGIVIGIFDQVNINPLLANMEMEAAWAEFGALCIAPMNYRVHRPHCYPDLVLEECGPGYYADDAMLLTEFSMAANEPAP